MQIPFGPFLLHVNFIFEVIRDVNKNTCMLIKCRDESIVLRVTHTHHPRLCSVVRAQVYLEGGEGSNLCRSNTWGFYTTVNDILNSRGVYLILILKGGGGGRLIDTTRLLEGGVYFLS